MRADGQEVTGQHRAYIQAAKEEHDDLRRMRWVVGNEAGEGKALGQAGSWQGHTQCFRASLGWRMGNRELSTAERGVQRKTGAGARRKLRIPAERGRRDAYEVVLGL